MLPAHQPETWMELPPGCRIALIRFSLVVSLVVSFVVSLVVSFVESVADPVVDSEVPGVVEASEVPDVSVEPSDVDVSEVSEVSEDDVPADSEVSVASGLSGS